MCSDANINWIRDRNIVKNVITSGQKDKKKKNLNIRVKQEIFGQIQIHHFSKGAR